MRHIKSTLIAMAAIAGISSAALADDIVILDSSVGAIAIGDVVSDERVVSIPNGGSVTIILASGDTKIIDGPFNGPLGAAERVESAGLNDLTATRGGDTKVLGAVRAPKWEITN